MKPPKFLMWEKKRKFTLGPPSVTVKLRVRERQPVTRGSACATKRPNHCSAPHRQIAN
jgi:hypothetical protein